MDTFHAPSVRESRVATAYAALYLSYLFATLESELVHWLTLVILPFVIALVFGDRPRKTSEVFATFGLRREGWMRGMGWALLLGTIITVLQVMLFGHRAEILAVIESGRALWLYPLTPLLMFLMAGFTE